MSGPDPKNENKIQQIEEVIKMGFDVEIDVRSIDDKIFLGHDDCIEEVKKDWIEERSNNLWIHCKNLDAVNLFSKTSFNWFWHQQDDYTLTSKGFVWTYPCRSHSSKSIVVLPELCGDNYEFLCSGVCSDFPLKYK